MEYRQREYPMFSACGLNCGLCPRYQTDGSSKCPGCSGEGFLTKHPTCGALSCSQRKGYEYCFQCDEFPCPKYDGAGKKDSFITHLHQFRDMEKAKSLGMDTYRRELDEKIAILEQLLQSYNDGRRKSFFCLAVNLLELCDLRQIMERLSHEIHTDIRRLRGTGYELAVNPNYAIDEQSQFDILSFDADGTMIAIEVKSTEKGLDTPFNLSVAEHAMAKQCAQNGQRYEIHRVYHATDPARRGRFIITAEELFRDYELIPKQYTVQRI